MTQPAADWELLREYVEHGSEQAFARIVSAHIDMVYSAALRQTQRRDLAEEVAQVTFVILSQKAATLRSDVVLGAWLHRTAHFSAANILRTEARRRAHERKAAAMTAEYQRVDSSWERLAPVLDEGVARLNEKDRAAILLRYFQRKSLAETGQVLGVSEDAAGMRVARAVGKLREFFRRRGVVLPAAALAGVMTANAVQAAPGGLAGKVAGAIKAGTTGGGAAAGTAMAVGRAMAMAEAKRAAVVAGAGFGVAAAVVLGAALATMPLWKQSDRPETPGRSTLAPPEVPPSLPRPS